MPVTPLHIGIPGLISYKFPKRVDIVATLVGSVAIDIDFFLYLLIGTPVHGYLHTFISAILLGTVIVPILYLLRNPMIRVKEWFKWETESSVGAIVIGSFLGTLSHVLLDSFIYWEMNPFYPLLGNPMWSSAGQNIIFIGVYALSGITTFFLLFLYVWKINKKAR